tara:strand:- start:173 stop:430 length:258 start_codon:yes stop_codon:yes gene_type:complete
MANLTAYPIPITGDNVLISAATPIQIAAQENQLTLSDSVIPTDSFYTAGLSAGQGNNSLKFKWYENTMWVAQTSGSPVFLGVYSW